MTPRRGWDIRTLQWSVGAFLLALGTFVTVAPHAFPGGLATLLGDHLALGGAAFLVAGTALLGVAALAPRAGIVWAAHLAACLALLALLVAGILSSSAVAGATYAALALATALAPALRSDTSPDRTGARDLLTTALAAAATLAGGLLLSGLPFPWAPRLGLPPVTGPLVGVALAAGGAPLLLAHVRPVPPVIARVAALVVGSAFLLLGGLSAAISSWPGVLLYVGFGSALLTRPWLTPRLDRVEPASLRTRLAVILALLAGAPLLLGVALMAGREEQETVERTLARQQVLAGAMAEHVEDYLSLHRAALTVLAAQPGLLDRPPDEQRRMLAAAQAAYPDVTAFSTSTASGEQLARGDGQPPGPVAGTPSFEQTRRTNAPSLTVGDSPPLGPPLVSLGQPVHAADGGFAGYVSGTLATARLADRLAQATGLVPGQVVTVVDRDGRVLLTTDPAGPAFGTNLATEPPVVATANRATGALRHGAGAGDRLAGYALVPDAGWRIVVEQPAAAPLMNVRTGREAAAFGLLVTLAGAAVAGWLLAGWLAAPLAGLAHAAKRLARGQPDTPLPSSSIAEVRSLTSAFATMRDQVGVALAAERQARLEAEAAGERAISATAITHRLQRATAALSAAMSVDAALEAVLREGKAALGAERWLIALLDVDSAELKLAAASGHPEDRLAFARSIPLHAAVPIAEVVRTGDAVWIASQTEFAARYPHLSAERAASGNEAAALVPVRAGGRVLGGLAVSFAAPRDLDADERAFLITLGEQCGQALERARLHENERQAAGEAEASRHRAAMLADASRLFAEAGLDVTAILDILTSRLSEEIGDTGSALLLAADGDALDLVAVHARHPEVLAIARTQVAAVPLRRGAGIVGGVVATGEPIMHNDLQPTTLPPNARPEDQATIARLGLRAVLVVPLRARGQVLGALALARYETARPYTADDQALAQDLADRAGLVLESARRYAAEQQERAAAERARERLAFLAEAGRRLAESLAPETTADQVARLALPVLGDYCLVDLTDDGRTFRRVGAAHADPARDPLVQALRAFPFDPARPQSQSTRALAARQPVLLDTVDDDWLRTIAQDADHLRLLYQLAPTAVLTAPLLARGRGLGVLTLVMTAASGRRFGDDDVALAGMLAARSALALDNARLFATEELARRRAGFLAEASAALAALMNDEAATFEHIARLVTPAFGDYCLLDLVMDDGRVQRVVAIHADPAKQPLMDGVRAYPPDLARSTSTIARVLRTGQPALAQGYTPATLDQIALDPDHRRLLGALAPQAVAIAPLRARERTLGALTVAVATPDRALGSDDLALITELAARAGLALDNARLYAAERAARTEAEVASTRTARLQAVTVALAEAATVDEVVDVVIRDGFEVLGARGGGVTRLSADGTALEGLRFDGYPAALTERWRLYPLDRPTPAARAIQTGAPVWVESAAVLAADYDIHPSATVTAGDCSWGAVPLVVEGRTIGALVLGFAREGALAPADRVYADALGRLCAQALERARLYDAERTARQEAEAAVRTRDAFLSIAAHELKTPTTGIKGAAQLMARRHARGDLDPVRLARTLGALVESADRLARLVDDLLDVARLRTGLLTLDRQPVDLVALTRQVAERWQEGLSNGHALRLELPPAPAIVLADQDRLGQVLDNVIDNAIKYSPDGGAIDVALRPDSDGVVLSVRDDGIGLPDGAAETIFAPFGRAENAERSYLPGMGLGLFICRGIIERHDGRIWAESLGEHHGTTVAVWLPRAGSDADAGQTLRATDGRPPAAR